MLKVSESHKCHIALKQTQDCKKKPGILEKLEFDNFIEKKL